ncbi:RICIN domain-containing protein [Actinoplanes sp. CA-051413]|uniref:RICIN domain-containing protein n=1 Tax=Actinoplanes sp. CA-051413 TaxID=3239899 RepID=UPI003D963827
MSTHRRPAPRGEAPSSRRRAPADRGRRRANPRPHRLLPVLLGVAMLGIGGVVGPSVVGGGWTGDGDGQDGERITYAARPADNPGLGLVYFGLKPGDKDSLCAGVYELDEETCTHGPDPAPAGLKVTRDVAPVTAKVPEPADPAREAASVPPDAEIVRDQGGSALSPGAPALIPDAAPGEADFVMGTHDVACEGDGRTGKRVQVLYLHEFGTPSRYADFLGSMRTWSAGVDQIFDASAAETGGSRHVRFVTTPQCRVDVAEVQVPEAALESFTGNIDALQTLGYNRTDRKYLIFADTNVYCGIGTFVADKRPGLGNRNNGGPSYGRVDAGCWSSVVAAREVTQMLGARLQDSPNSTGAGSCTDDYDLMCNKDRSDTALRTVCPKKHEDRLDCGHDDYFNTNPKPKSYLADNWNVAQSEFLLRSDGGDDIPDAPNAVPAEPDATPRATPSKAAPEGPEAPEPTATGGDASDGGGDALPPGAEPGATAPGVPAPTTGAPAADPTTAAPPPVPTTPAAAPGVQAVLEVREPNSTSVRLTWSAAGPKAGYDVEVDGVKIATTVATRAKLIGLRPDAKYQVAIRSTNGYLAKGTAQSAPAARPAANTWFVLTNSLTGGAADLYAARTANGTPVTLGGPDGDSQQQWKLVPAAAGAFSLQSRATGKCVIPLDGNPVAGAPLVQGDCTSAGSGRWSLFATDYGFSLRTTAGGLVAGVGSQRFGASRLLVLQQPEQARHQSWTAVPG